MISCSQCLKVYKEMLALYFKTLKACWTLKGPFFLGRTFNFLHFKSKFVNHFSFLMDFWLITVLYLEKFLIKDFSPTFSLLSWSNHRQLWYNPSQSEMFCGWQFKRVSVFPVVVITNYHKLVGFKQHTFILLKFWRPETRNESYGIKIRVSEA